MSKLSLFLALVALGMTSVAAGLWFTRPPDSDARVAVLETKLREAEATIARLNKQHSGSSLSHAATSESRSSLISAADPDSLSGTVPPATASPATVRQGAPSVAGTLSGQAASSAALPARSDKRLAEAEARYSDLINRFGLQPDEKEAFKVLAARRDDIRKKVFSKLADPTLTAPQRQAILAEGQGQMGQVDSSVKEFLNNDQDYEAFQKWDHQNVERNQMDDARSIFEKNGVELSADQETWLTDELYGLRRNTQGLGDPYSAETLAGRRIDQPYIASALAKHDADTAVLLQNARSHMSQAQISALATVRYQQRVRMEAQLWNMARTTGQR